MRQRGDYLARAALSAQSIAVTRDFPVPRLAEEVRANARGTVEDRYDIALRLAASYLRDAADCIAEMEVDRALGPTRRKRAYTTSRGDGNELYREDGHG
jgi:hypothetical protein